MNKVLRAFLVTFVLFSFLTNEAATNSFGYLASDSTAAKPAVKKATKPAQTKEKAKAAQPKKEAKTTKSADKSKKDSKSSKTKKDSKPAASKDSKSGKTTPTKSTGGSSSSGSVSSDARFHKPYKTWALSLVPGITEPYTDIKYRRFLGVLNPKNENQWGVALHGIHMINPAFGIQVSFIAGALQGVADSNMASKDDYKAMVTAGLPADGVYFYNNFYEGSVNLYWNITNTVFGVNRFYRSQLTGKPMRDRKVSLYTYLGMGFNSSTVTVKDLRTNLTLPQFYRGRLTDFVVPVGIGLKFKVTKSFDIGFEGSFHFTFTDKLDGFQYQHPNKARDDFYSHMGISFTYKIGTKKRDRDHTEWKHPEEDILNNLTSLNKRVDKLYKDSDGDGVSDVFDKDNNTPEGANVYGNGMEVDSDGDGIPDKVDMEPFTDKGAKVDEFGRAIDSDGDGVPDHKDLEPNTPKGDLTSSQGVSLNNKFMDKSKDSLLNNSRGDLYLPSIYFDFDRAEIQRQFDDELYYVATKLRENQGMKLLVSGHCDEKGNDPYNDDLGMRRAKNVMEHLIRVYNISPAVLKVTSKGKQELEKNARDQINRRVDFIIVP